MVARLAFLVGSASLVGACSEGPRFGLPEPASGQGEDILGLWRGAFVAALVVGALVWGLIVWAGLRYRRRNDDLPSQTPENIPIEVLYTVVPLLIVAVLFGFTMVTQERVTALGDPDVVVEVTGFQWSWQFVYPDEDVVIGSDGVEPPELVVPVGSTVRFDLATPDVIHSFWVPELLVKRDLIPDVENAIDVEVTRAGTWTGRCAEFCGLEHYDMTFTFRAVPPDAYEAWLEERREAGDLGDGDDERSDG
ncbi:MAG: cytochrome c oxidase subunit II [Acidimicrobiales bacterium]